MEPKATLLYQDGKVRFEISLNGELVNLTDMWKAAGSDSNRKPVIWFRHEGTQDFVVALEKELKVTVNHLLKTKTGRDGGTFSHWQIAVEYARYLSPKLAVWANEELRHHFQAEQNPEWAYGKYGLKSAQEMEKAGCSPGEILQRLQGITVTKLFQSSLGKHGCCQPWHWGTIIRDMTRIITGETPQQIKDRTGSSRTRDVVTSINRMALLHAEAKLTEVLDKKGITNYDDCRQATEVVAGLFADASKQVDEVLGLNAPKVVLRKKVA
jgi:hypothetical protein